MRIILQVTAGPACGKRIVMGARQILSVGRTEWADRAFPDSQMSSVHFGLESTDNGCFVADRESSNGTYVNRQRIRDATPLRDGDQVQAGQTIFRVVLEGDDVVMGGACRAAIATQAPSGGHPYQAMPGPAYAQVADPPAYAPYAPAPTRPRFPQQTEINYSLEKCGSGLTLCKGSVDEIPPADMVVLIGQSFPAYFLMDFNRLGMPRPAELAAPVYLFDWLDAPAADVVSPVIVAREELPAWSDLIAEGWGQDGLISLFSAQERSALVDRLRAWCGSGRRDGNPDDPILGACWPSVLGSLLAHHEPDHVGAMMSGIEAVLLEDRRQPDAWRLFGGPQLADLLDGLGMRRRTLERTA